MDRKSRKRKKREKQVRERKLARRKWIRGKRKQEQLEAEREQQIERKARELARIAEEEAEQ